MQGAHTSTLAMSNESTGGDQSRDFPLTTCSGTQCRKQKLIGSTVEGEFGTVTAEHRMLHR